jgi:hypothetical protein
VCFLDNDNILGLWCINSSILGICSTAQPLSFCIRDWLACCYRGIFGKLFFKHNLLMLYYNRQNQARKGIGEVRWCCGRLRCFFGLRRHPNLLFQPMFRSYTGNIFAPTSKPSHFYQWAPPDLSSTFFLHLSTILSYQLYNRSSLRLGSWMGFSSVYGLMICSQPGQVSPLYASSLRTLSMRFVWYQCGGNEFRMKCDGWASCAASELIGERGRHRCCWMQIWPER